MLIYPAMALLNGSAIVLEDRVVSAPGRGC